MYNNFVVLITVDGPEIDVRIIDAPPSICLGCARKSKKFHEKCNAKESELSITLCILVYISFDDAKPLCDFFHPVKN